MYYQAIRLCYIISFLFLFKPNAAASNYKDLAVPPHPKEKKNEKVKDREKNLTMYVLTTNSETYLAALNRLISDYSTCFLSCLLYTIYIMISRAQRLPNENPIKLKTFVCLQTAAKTPKSKSTCYEINNSIVTLHNSSLLQSY